MCYNSVNLLIILQYSPDSRKWGTSKAPRRQRFQAAAPVRLCQQGSSQCRHTSRRLRCGRPFAVWETFFYLKRSEMSKKWKPAPQVVLPNSRDFTDYCNSEQAYRDIGGQQGWPTHRDPLFLIKHSDHSFITDHWDMWLKRGESSFEFCNMGWIRKSVGVK